MSRVLSPSLSELLIAHAAGTSAVTNVAHQLGDDGAELPTPCPEWDVRRLLTHLWCTAQRYHRLLDACLAHTPLPMHVDGELAALNQRDVDAAPHLAVTDLADRFRISAESFVERARRAWDVGPFQRGGVSVGEAIGIAAFEWHVHAWDLHQAAGSGHHPACAEILRQSWDSTVPHLKIDLAGDPWRAVLSAAERILPNEPSPPVCRVSTLDSLNTKHWDAGAPTFYQSSAWLSAEATTVSEETRVIVASRRGEHVGGLAVLPPWMPGDDPDEAQVVASARVLGTAPRLRVGGLRGYSSDLAVRLTDERVVVSRALLQEAVALAEAEEVGPPVMVWATEQATLTVLAADPTSLPVLLGAEVNMAVPPMGLPGLVEALPKNCRREVRRDQRRFASSGLHVSTKSLESCWERCAPMLGQLHAKYGNVAPAEHWYSILHNMATRLPESVVFLVEDGDVAVAFSLGYPSGTGFTMRAAGFDYQRLPANAATYFSTVIHQPLMYASARGLDHVHLGRDSFNAKVRRGGLVSLLWAVGRPTNGVTATDVVQHNRTILAGLETDFAGCDDDLEAAVDRCRRRGWC